jgi:hypothetical protein
MLEAKSQSKSLLAEAENSRKFNDQMPHQVSDIVEGLGNLTVPVRSSMMIGNDVSTSVYNRNLLDHGTVNSISGACTKLSDEKLSPIERSEITKQLQATLMREVRVLGELNSRTQSIADSSSILDAQEVLRSLERVIVVNNSRLSGVDRFRVPYELGGEFLSVRQTLKALPSEPGALVETLLNDFSYSNKDELSEAFRATMVTLAQYRLDYRQRLNVLKCLALTSNDPNVQNLAIKEYFTNLKPEDHVATVAKMIEVDRDGSASLFMPQYREHLSEQFTGQVGNWSGGPETLLNLTQLATLVDNGAKFPEIGSFVCKALYAVGRRPGVTDEVTQVAHQLSGLVAEEYGHESPTYRKYQLDFKLAAPTWWESLKATIKGWTE